MKDKYILLDFDGVCTSGREGGGSYLGEKPQDYGFDQQCIDRLKNLCKDVGAKIIISSNWRRYKPDGGWFHHNEFYVNPLPRLMKELGSLVVGTLPTDKYLTKSEATILWLETFDDPPHFVIFDDDKREGFQYAFEYGIMRKFILTNAEFGLTDEDVILAKDKFNEQSSVRR